MIDWTSNLAHAATISHIIKSGLLGRPVSMSIFTPNDGLRRDPARTEAIGRNVDVGKLAFNVSSCSEACATLSEAAPSSWPSQAGQNTPLVFHIMIRPPLRSKTVTSDMTSTTSPSRRSHPVISARDRSRKSSVLSSVTRRSYLRRRRHQFDDRCSLMRPGSITRSEVFRNAFLSPTISVSTSVVAVLASTPLRSFPGVL